MRLASKDTIYKKKMIFNALLSEELGKNDHRIVADFEWVRTRRVFSFQVKDDNSIHIWININCKEQLFKDFGCFYELTIRYRVFFISAYLSCLNTARNCNPKNYFNGLVTLCAVNGLVNRHKTDVFSPLGDNKPPKLEPIDVFCSIQALARLMIECNNMLSEKEINVCRQTLDKYITYSMLPEIGYKNKRPVYALLFELNKLKKTTQFDARILNRFDFLKRSSSIKHEIEFSGLSDDTYAQPFWIGAELRLQAYSEDSNRFLIRANTPLGRCYAQYKESCVKYSSDIQNSDIILLQDNYYAIKRLSRRIEKKFVLDSIKTGALHYY